MAYSDWRVTIDRAGGESDGHRHQRHNHRSGFGLGFVVGVWQRVSTVKNCVVVETRGLKFLHFGQFRILGGKLSLS